jgi:hypothetical protein
MRDSKFCLHVRGTRVQSPRLIEGMMFGCVPVILADGYELPMSWLFDWSKFSIRLPEIEYRRLPDVLAQVSLFLVIFGYFWLFLVILVIFGYFGYFWLFWLFLVIFGYSRMGSCTDDVFFN